LLEGLIISSYANDVHLAYIYIAARCTKARVPESRHHRGEGEGVSRQEHFGQRLRSRLHVHRGAGAYICGEETGLIESLEGNALIRASSRPISPLLLGLYQCPTIVNKSRRSAM